MVTEQPFRFSTGDTLNISPSVLPSALSRPEYSIGDVSAGVFHEVAGVGSASFTSRATCSSACVGLYKVTLNISPSVLPPALSYPE